MQHPLARDESDVINRLAEYSQKMSMIERQRLVRGLWEIDRQREPWATTRARQRTYHENRSWQLHAWLILQDWNDENAYLKWERYSALENAAKLRFLMIELAIQLYRVSEGKPPATLDELVPVYLPAVPQDPFGNGPLVYRVRSGRTFVYSVGWNGADDSSVETIASDVWPPADLLSTMRRVVGP